MCEHTARLARYPAVYGSPYPAGYGAPYPTIYMAYIRPNIWPDIGHTHMAYIRPYIYGRIHAIHTYMHAQMAVYNIYMCVCIYIYIYIYIKIRPYKGSSGRTLAI